MSRKQRKEKKPKAPVETQGAVKARPSVTIETWNEKQKDYYISLLSAPCVVCQGPAGVGKTYLAASVAAKELAEKRIRKIILSRANVATGKSLGSFPGTVEEKMAPWLMPITDVLREKLGHGFYDYATRTGIIEVQPIETIRGRSFNDAIVLMDEAQQLDVAEIKAVTTRIGDNAKLFLMGDAAQRDIRVDGLEWFRSLVEKYKLPIDFHTFTSEDIVRSDLCGLLVKAFEKESQ